MAKFYNNITILSEPSSDNDAIKKKNLTDALYKHVSETIIDVRQDYELSSDGTGLTIVDDSSTPSSTEIKLSDVQAKVLSTDTHTYAVGEIVILVNEKNHEESHEEEIYARVDQIPEGSTTMSVQRLNDLWGNVVVNPYIPS